jgi:hypothetical protein
LETTDEVILYVTGPASALAAVLDAAWDFGVPVTLMHYDKARNAYCPQQMFEPAGLEKFMGGVTHNADAKCAFER